MNNQKLTILGLVAAVMLLGAIVSTQWAHRKPAMPSLPQYLIQGLSPDKIAAIDIKAEKDSVRLVRAEKGFVVATKDNYPAVIGEINGVIAACLDLKPAELKTESAANHADLGVTDETARYKILLQDAESKTIAGFWLSKPHEQTNEMYVRPVDGDKVYRVAENTWPYISPMDFIDKELINAKTDEITTVSVKTTEGEYTLTRAEGGNITLDKMPEGKQFKGSDYKYVFEALSGLRLDDVQKESDKTKDLAFDTTYVCRMKDSTVYTVAIAKKDDKYYIRCDADFTDKSDVTMTQGVTESEEELKKKEAKLLARDKAVDFRKKHRGWIYTIPSYKAENLTKKAGALVEDIKKEEPKVETPADGQPATTTPAAAPALSAPASAEHAAPAESKPEETRPAEETQPEP